MKNFREYMTLSAILLLIYITRFGIISSSLHNYALDDVPGHIRVLNVVGSSFSYDYPGYYHFMYVLKTILSLDNLVTVEYSRIVSIFAVLFVYIIIKDYLKNNTFAAIGALIFGISIYEIHLSQIVLRNMFAGFFYVMFFWAILRFQNSDRKPVFGVMAAILLFLILISHKLPFIIAVSGLFVLFYINKITTMNNIKKISLYSIGFASFGLLGIILFKIAVSRYALYLIPRIDEYGLSNFLAHLYLSKLLLICYVCSLFLVFGAWGYLKTGKNADISNKILYWVGLVFMTLLIIPIGWAYPLLVFLIGFFFAFYFLLSILRSGLSSNEKLAFAFFIATAFWSRNMFYGINFYSFRFEEMIGLPFVIMIMIGLKTFINDCNEQNVIFLPQILTVFKSKTKIYACLLLVFMVLASNLFLINNHVLEPIKSRGENVLVYKTINSEYVTSILQDKSISSTKDLARFHSFPETSKIIFYINLKGILRRITEEKVEYTVIPTNRNKQMKEQSYTMDIFDAHFPKIYCADYVSIYETK